MKKYFKCDFTGVPTSKLHDYNLMLRDLETCIPVDSTDSEYVKQIWDFFYMMGVYVRGELHDRNEEEREEARKKATRRRKGEAVPVVKSKGLVKPKKAHIPAPKMRVEEATRPKVKSYVGVPKKWKK